jgi:hypothetical protein
MGGRIGRCDCMSLHYHSIQFRRAGFGTRSGGGGVYGLGAGGSRVIIPTWCSGVFRLALFGPFWSALGFCFRCHHFACSSVHLPGSSPFLRPWLRMSVDINLDLSTHGSSQPACLVPSHVVCDVCGPSAVRTCDLQILFRCFRSQRCPKPGPRPSSSFRCFVVFDLHARGGEAMMFERAGLGVASA